MNIAIYWLLLACIAVLVGALIAQERFINVLKRRFKDDLAKYAKELEADNAEAQEMLMLYTRHVFQTDINRMVNGSLFYADGEWKQGEVSGTWVIPTDAQSLAIALQERAEWQSTQTMSR